MKAEVVKAILGTVGRYIRRTFEPRIKAVEDRVGELPTLVEKAVAAIPAPKDGTSVTVDDVAPLLQKMVDAVELPQPAEVDTDAVVADVAKRLLASDGLKALCDLVANEAVKALPPAKPGENGKSVTVDDVLAALMPRIEERLEAIVAKGLLELERRGRDIIDRAVASIPKPKKAKNGIDGKDGLSVEDFTGEYVPERGFVLRASRGEVVREFVLPYMVHRGFWSEGKIIRAGESVTHDGALWIAKRDTTTKPCLENADDWTLAARKGRDGKDGRNGIDKTAAVKVGPDA